MIRTQIQLTEKQAEALRKISLKQRVSMAELIRKGVDSITHSALIIDSEERKKRAIHAAGKFRSGKSDISEKHDDYLTEAMKP